MRLPAAQEILFVPASQDALLDQLAIRGVEIVGHQVAAVIARANTPLVKSFSPISRCQVVTKLPMRPIYCACQIASLMAGQQELLSIAAQFELPVIAIDTLIRYRREHAPEDESIQYVREICSTVRSVCSFPAALPDIVPAQSIR